jgi:DNA-binding transcriptional LysR family regulator
MRSDLNALAVFATVAEERSFRAAADRLGVTRSAVSQSIRRLEETLGATILHRTTRSVALTEAGERLRADIAPAIAEMRAAMEGVRSLSGPPRGQLRIAVDALGLVSDALARHAPRLGSQLGPATPAWSCQVRPRACRF